MTDDFADLPGTCSNCPLKELCQIRGCFGPEPLQVGVSGTRHISKITRKAQEKLAYFLYGLKVEDPADKATIHHGCCTGWDGMAHHTALRALLLVHCHPPENQTHMAGCLGGHSVTWSEPKPYKDRNQDIVDAADILLACPEYREDDPRAQSSGTWQTVRMARRKGIPILFFRPDGHRVLEHKGDTYVLEP